MKILSMTATFGKLSHQTLTLEPGMNIIEAPNEWGKSTWCAFLMAMLYGIDTGSRTKTGFLADKEHYAPWSGEPMSGSMTFLWEGRQITLERQSKGRIPMGEVRAFETQTGVPVPELSVAMPGQVLLGVERSVFARAGFLKLADMPVTEDESLRRRLNALVTTADESDASDDLAQKLRDLKNKCRFNKKGRLPELETEQAELQRKLQQLQALQEQSADIAGRQQSLSEQIRKLENHKQALAYGEQLQYTQKLAAAQLSADAAEQALQQAKQESENLPGLDTIRAKLLELQQLRETRDALHTKAQLLPPLPQMPVSPEPFRGKDAQTAVKDARLDAKVLEQLTNDLKKPIPYIIGGICIVAGVVLALLPGLPIKLCGILLAVVGVTALLCGVAKQKKLKGQIADLMQRYRDIPADRWETEAEAYADAQQTYNQTVDTRQQELAAIHTQLEENTAAVTRLTDGMSLAQFEDHCRQELAVHDRLQEQQRAYEQAQQVLQALSAAGKPVEPPAFADTLELSKEQTDRQLSEMTFEVQRLHQLLGQCQGQMASLGQQEHLLSQLQQITGKIDTLERYYRALIRAQETLQLATQELQRRFAPRISQRAQELFARLTGQRYQKLSLRQDLSVEAGAEGENTLKSTLWRSDGTVDQLYLALRLAVAEELTPASPLVLDDALVRFDDVRLTATLKILQEEARHKQVILFTCQSRENNML